MEVDEVVPEPQVQEPEPEAPAQAAAPEVRIDRQLDLCFLCDATGSMGQYIHAAQKNICAIVDKVVQSEKADVQFALVSYRDHPPQDASYVTRVFPFTADPDAMQRNVATMSASGGGDGPEAVTAALHDALHLPWRPNAAKIAVLIADAPPHGLEPTGDGFPNGDPLGRDPLAIAREMAAHGITVYAVGCEPALGAYRFARDFMCTLSEITGGQAIALASAKLLADVIINGSAEEISLTMLQREVDEEIELVQAAAAARREALDEEECCKRVSANLQARSVRTKHMRTDGRMANSKAAIWHKSPMQSLAAAKVELCAELGEEPEDDLDAMAMGGALRMESRACRSAPRSRVTAPSLLARVGDAASSMFGRKKKRAMPVAETLARRGAEDSGSESTGSDTTPEFRAAFASPPAAGGYASRSMAFSSAPAAAPQPSSTFMAVEEDVISMDQVSRMCKRSAMRKA